MNFLVRGGSCWLLLSPNQFVGGEEANWGRTLCYNYTDSHPLLPATSSHHRPSSDSRDRVSHARWHSRGPRDRRDAELGSRARGSSMLDFLGLSLLVRRWRFLGEREVDCPVQPMLRILGQRRWRGVLMWRSGEGSSTFFGDGEKICLFLKKKEILRFR